MKLEILTVDKPNKNGRIYPRALVEREMERIRKEFIAERRWLIEGCRSEQSTLNLKNVVGMVNDVFIEGDTVFVEAVFFDNVPNGPITETLLKEGLASLRTAGMGTIHKQEDGTYIVGEDWELLHCFVTDEPA